MDENNKCNHSISIRTTPEKLWEAFTAPDVTKEYWLGYHIESNWRVGSTWELKAPDGKVHAAGKILEIDPPRKLVLSWRDEIRPELTAEGYSRCAIDIEPSDDAVTLTITQSIEQSNSKLIALVATSWPKVTSNLKSFLETGKVASQ